MKKLSTEEFIQKAIQVHGDKYDYSQVVYINSRTKVCIICLNHGTFWQQPFDHLYNHGCRKCNIINQPQCRPSNTEDFIKKAKKVHNKYDYSKVIYVNNKTKICIICPEHGEFWQTPNAHIQGQGCPKCAKNLILIKRSSNTIEFIQKANQVHNNKYNYLKVEYINDRIKICIICPKHGEFWQSPNSHLQGCGCPICKSSKGELRIILWLKKYRINFIPQYKFNDCRGIKRTLPFDFYLPKFNTCIEFDGKQHFGIGKWACKSINDNDQIKNEYCKQNNIHLIRIPYYEFSNIEKILKISLMPRSLAFD